MKSEIHKTETLSYSEALREALRLEMLRSKDVFLMGEDIAAYGGAFGVTRGLVDEFGTARVMNTPISEAGIVGMAVGCALMGGRPIVEIMFSDFTFLAFDQLLNSAAKFHYVYGNGVSVPLVLRTTGGTGRSYGPTHSQSIEGFLLHMPGIKVVMPSTPQTAAGLLISAIRDDNPVVFIENRSLYSLKEPVAHPIEPVEIGKARIVRPGDHITLVAYRRMVHESMAAAPTLAAEGISAEVIDLMTISPMDTDTILTSVEKTGRVLLVEEGPMTGGVSAESGFRIFENLYDYLDAPIARLTMPDIPVPFAPELEAAAAPSRATIAARARQLMNLRS